MPASLLAAVPRCDAIIAGIQQGCAATGTATLADVGPMAAWAAATQARTMTADINISCGAIED